MELLTLVTTLQYLIEIDTDLLLAINGHHTPYWDTFMYMFSEKEVWIPMYLSLIYVLKCNSSWRTFFICAVALGCIFLFTDMFLASVIRPWVARLRPSNPNNPLSEIIHIVGNYRSGKYGFPSNHAANCWALTFFVALLFKQKPVNLMLTCWVLLTCYSRSYLGVHYPGDLLAGLVFGLLAAITAYYIFVRVNGNRLPDKIEHAWLPVITGISTIVILFIISFFISF